MKYLITVISAAILVGCGSIERVEVLPQFPAVVEVVIGDEVEDYTNTVTFGWTASPDSVASYQLEWWMEPDGYGYTNVGTNLTATIETDWGLTNFTAEFWVIAIGENQIESEPSNSLILHSYPTNWTWLYPQTSPNLGGPWVDTGQSWEVETTNAQEFIRLRVDHFSGIRKEVLGE